MNENAELVLSMYLDRPAQYAQMLGYELMRDDLHGEWIRKMVLSKSDMTLQAHRGSYKTTCLSIALAILMQLRGDLTIMFLRKTETDVAEVVRSVLRVLSHPVTQSCYLSLYGNPLNIGKASSNEIVTSAYTAPRGASQLLGIGIGGSITGKHADIIVTDDIVNRSDRVSHAERERTKAAYQELQNILIPGGRFINTGTPWHKEDAFTLMPEPMRFDCYSTGMLTTAQIDHLRQSMSPSLFAANYELRHIAAENALFPEAPTFAEDPGWLRNGMAHIDAAYDGEDYTAITLARRVGDRIYMYGRLWRAHVDTVLDSCLTECRKYRCEPIWMETNGDKGYLSKELRARGAVTHPYPENMNKYLKISTYLRKWWTKIVWVRGTDPEYLAQIQNYTEDAEHDDAPDSAACCCRKLDRIGLQ